MWNGKKPPRRNSVPSTRKPDLRLFRFDVFAVQTNMRLCVCCVLCMQTQLETYYVRDACDDNDNFRK